MEANRSRQHSRASLHHSPPSAGSAAGQESYNVLQKCPITVHVFAGIKLYYLDTREVTNLMSLASLKASQQVEGQ